MSAEWMRSADRGNFRGSMQTNFYFGNQRADGERWEQLAVSRMINALISDAFSNSAHIIFSYYVDFSLIHHMPRDLNISPTL